MSATLRRLIDEARRTHDAIRALYRGDLARFSSPTDGWPPVPSPHTSAPEPI